MLFPRHPKPVVPAKAVATQVVKQEHREVQSTHLIIVEKPNAPETPEPRPEQGT